MDRENIIMHHKKTKQIITDLGLKGSVLRDVIGVSQSQYGNKFNQYSGNSFNEKDYLAIVSWLKSYIDKI